MDVHAESWVDFAAVWDRIGHPGEKIYSAFIAQTLCMSPQFCRYAVQRILKSIRAGDAWAVPASFDGDDISVRTEVFLSIAGSEDINPDSPSEHGRPRTLPCVIADLEIKIGGKLIIAVENKVEGDSLAPLQPEQLHRYAKHYRNQGIPFLLVLLCPAHYRIRQEDIPQGNLFLRLSYLDFSRWVAEFSSMHPCAGFEAAYFDAFRRFLRRVEVEPEGQRIESIRELNKGDITLCAFPSTNDGEAYEGEFVTRVDEISGKCIRLTHFYDEPAEFSRPVIARAPAGGDYFHYYESWTYHYGRDSEGRLIFRCKGMHCYPLQLSPDHPDRLRVPPGGVSGD
jgi:hypothetical protein